MENGATKDKILLIDNYNGTFHNLLAQDMEKALLRCREVRVMSEAIGYQKGISDADFNLGWYHLWRCEFNQAFPLLKNLPEQYKALGDDYGYIRSLNSLGVIHLDMGNYDSALPYFVSSLKFARDNNEKEREATVLANLGLLYEGMEKIELAYDYFTDALNIPELNDTGFYSASKCVALYYLEKKEWSKAASSLDKAIQRAQQKDDLHFVTELLVVRGMLWQKQNNNAAAVEDYTQGLEISRKLGNKKVETEHLYELGCLALNESKPDDAISYFNQVMALAEEKGIGSFLCKSYEKLSAAYEVKEDYRSALHYLKTFNQAEKDYNLRKAELKLQSLEFEHELEKQQQQAEIYRLKNIELEKANKEILKLANHDNLTGLPNRRLFMNQLESAAKAAGEDGTKVALCFIDLDNFKPINDKYGHTVGDKLLKTIAKRLSGTLRKQDMVARFGGDEFVLFVPELKTSADAIATGERIMHAMMQQFVIGEYQFNVSASIGISVYPDHSDDLSELISLADQAMYNVKTSGKNSCIIHI